MKNNDDPNKVIENYHEVEISEYTLTVADDDTTMPTMTAAEQTSLEDPTDIIRKDREKKVKDRECCSIQVETKQTSTNLLKQLE